MTSKTLPAAVVDTMNTALEGSGFQLNAEGVFVKGERVMGLRVVAALRGRVQVRTNDPSAELYWAGPAADVRAFTRAFWLSA